MCLPGHEGDRTYQSYDPEIVIDGQTISYVGNNPIKFFGHWINVDLGLNDTKQLIEDKLCFRQWTSVVSAVS